MRVLLWHVHGSWTTSFVQGAHEYLLPVDPQRSADGLGRARTWDWPAAAIEVPLDGLGGCEPDVVVLQREDDLELVRTHMGREPGRDLPAIYVEHNTPRGDVGGARHHLADRDDVPVVHVTHFNRTYWDCGRAPTAVVEHGVVDPGHRWTGELARAAVVVNEPVRRARITGTDLLPRLAREVPVDVMGMAVAGLADRLGLDAARLGELDDLPQARMHDEMARRGVYVHLARWTSLGLSLIEAMHLGMPVVALAATEAVVAVPQGAGVLSTDMDALAREAAALVRDRDRAAEMGARARQHALEHYGLDRFLADWDRLLKEVA